MKISHLGIAVRDLKNAEELYAKLLGVDDRSSTDDASTAHHEEVADQKVRIASFEVGDARIELTEATGPDSTIAKFIEKRGEGIHHIAFEVDDVAKELDRLKSLGFQLIDEKPRKGSHGMMIAFLHPKSTGGVLVEICSKLGELHPPAPSSSRGGGV